MDKLKWNKMCELLKIGYRDNQFRFYKRGYEFIKSDKDLQINQGGMGLGKTFAMAKLIQEFKSNFEHFFIATPIIQIKNEWAKELSKLKLDYVLWYSKNSHCIQKYLNPKFNVKDCNDDSIYNKELETWEGEKVYTEKCKMLASSINYLNFDIGKYYEDNQDHCFIPINKYHLKTKRIIVGDYFGFLYPNMYSKITDRLTRNSCLLIDEAHMIPERVSGILTKSLYLNKYIKEIKDEITSSDYYTQHHIDEYIKVKSSLKVLEKIKEKLIKISKEVKKEGRYSLPSFLSDWNMFSQESGLGWSLFDLRDSLNEFNKSEKENDEEDRYTQKFVKFIDNWKEKYADENYAEQFQYYNRKEEEIQLTVACKNPADYLMGIWQKWRKIILMSGTIPDEKYFKDMLGLNNLKIINEDLISSHKIKENIILYPKGNFTSKHRPKTYDENKALMKKILNELTGRTIIYVQSKSYSTKLEEQLKDFFKIYNFSKTENGFDVDNNLLNQLKKDFIKEKKAIAITHITGKVEGQNYLDDDGNNVSNIIIYGFPFPKYDEFFQDKIKLWTEKLGNLNEARKYVSFFPANSKIYQAVMRAKRDDSHNPIILLWSKEFAKGSPGYEYTYDELRGELIYDQDMLLKNIKKREDERKNL